MSARAIWAFCLYLSLFTIFTSFGQADSHTPTANGEFWFTVDEAAGGNPVYMIDIPIPTLDTEFEGPLPIFFDFPCDVSDCGEVPFATVDYSPEGFTVVSELLAGGGETYQFDDDGDYAFQLGANNVFTAAGLMALITIEDKPVYVAEPATAVLLLSGLVMVGLAKRKRARGKRRSSRL